MKMFKLRSFLFLFLFQILSVHAFGITASFTFTKVSPCAPTVVIFTNTSTHGPGVTYTWDFGLGSIVTASDNSSKEQLYTKAGQYIVKLKVSDGISSDSSTAIVDISSGPIASFTADPASGCSPLTVNFTSTSAQGESEIVKTSWDFRNGEYKEGTAVSYQYNNPGQYNVFLKVTDAKGCYSQIESEKSITVADKPVIAFAASDTFGCAPPLNVSFTNLSEGSSPLTYKWDFGNGKSSTDFSNSSVYDTAGTYNVSLKATDQYGCSDSLTKKSYITIGYKKGKLTVYDARDNIFNRSFLCDGLYKFVYSDPNLPAYTWSVTDNNSTTIIKGSSSLSYKVTGSGTVTIKLVFGRSSFCTDSITVSYAKSYIKAAFSLKDSLYCSLPRTVDLTNASQNADKVAWYMSGKFVSNDKVTTYSLTENDLPAETYQQLYSHEINVVTLPVKLVASNGGVCFDSVSKIIKIIKPLARFMPDKVSGCVPLQISFSDSSRSALGIDSYIYRIGTDQVASIGKAAVNYTITTPGEYDVTEIIRSGGCNDTSKIVRIIAGTKLKPDLTVSPSEVCNGGAISLSGSTENNPAVKMWRYISPGLFDLSLRSGPDTTIAVYADSSGMKNISLRVDYNGCISDTAKKNILNIKGPYGSFTGSFRCESSLKYHFRSAVKNSTSLVWNVDTITANNVDSLNYLFRVRGDYPVKLTASDLSTGCTLERTKIFPVRKVLSAFTLKDTIFCAGDTVTMDGSLSGDFINTCYNEGFLWYFGDDSPPHRTFLKKYYHIYSARGYDTISLVVKGDNGCSDTSKKVIYISRPSGSFTTDKTSGCVPEMSISFTNTSTDSTVVRWIWNYGDTQTDSTNYKNVTHIYKSITQKVYYPNITVYDKWSCSSSYGIPVHIIKIDGNFQASDNAVCLGETVAFTPSDTSNTIIFWNFGDSTVSTGRTHTYTKAGKYTVSLASSKEGCQDTITKLNYISVEKADANFTASDSILNCYPAKISFSHNNSLNSPAVGFLWTFGSTPLKDQSSGNVSYTFTHPGNFAATLTVRTLNNCEASSSKNILVLGPDAAITFTPKTICYNESVTFRLDSMKNVTSWKWFFGDGTTSTANPVTHTYTSRGKLIPSVQLINPTCTAIRVLDTLSVSNVQALFRSSDSSYVNCYGTKVNLVNYSKNGNSWDWLIDNVHVSYGYSLNNIIFSITGDHSITLVATEAGGCTDALSRAFTVNPVPVVSIKGDSVICTGKTSSTLTVDHSTGDKIRWAPSAGLNDAGAFSVTASPVVTTTYTANVTNSHACSATAEKTIKVNQPIPLTRSPLGDTTIYLGDRIQLVITTSETTVNYAWSPPVDISCTHCNDPWVYPSESTAYTVLVSDGCFSANEKFNIEVLNDFYLEAPSAFTPNGDSNNDLFKFESKNIAEFDLKIFNRFGEIVYKSGDVNQGWDGYVNGKAQNIDTYKYTVRAKTTHGYEFTRSGEFLLLR